MATLFQLPKAVPVSAGSSYASCKCHFYQAGTTTNITTYTTAALSVANANPVVADSNGVFAPIFIDEGTNATYKIRLVTSADALIYEVDNIPATLNQSALGAVLWPRTAAETSAGVTPTNYYYEPGNVLRYGTNTTPGTTDMTTAIQAAIDSGEAGHGFAYVPSGTYKITASLSIADGTPITLHGDGYDSVIVKGANVDMLSLGLKSELCDIRFDGAGATYTGRGVLIATGSGADGWQNIHDCTILDTASYNIEYTAAGSGWMSRIVNNRLGTYNRAAFCVKYHDADTNGPRLLANNSTLSPLADLGGSLGVNVVSNLAGENVGQTVPSIQMLTACQRAVVVGNTFECATSISIRGDEQIVTGNIMRGGYSLISGATDCVVFGNHGDAVANLDTDASGVTSNEVHGVAHTYTPTWTGSGSNPAIGDGTIVARYQRFGRRVHLQIDATMGSTTTYGTGTWSFSLPTTIPAPGSGSSYGACRMFDSGTIIRTGVSIVSGSTVTAEADSATGSVGTTVPFTWANGDRLSIDVIYNI